jgi:hypothetical protein
MQLMHVENASRNNTLTVNKSLFDTISKNKTNNKRQIEITSSIHKKSRHLESLAVPGKKYTHYGSIL